MKKKILCTLLAVSLVAILATGCSPQTRNTEENTPSANPSSVPSSSETAGYSTEKPLVMKVGNGVDTSNPQTIALQHFCDALKDATQGRITYELFPNCELGSDEEMTEMVRDNTLQLSEANLTIKDYEPEMYAFGLPYLFHSYDDAYDYLTNSDTAKQMWGNLKNDVNLQKVAIYLNGSRALTTGNIQVESPADLKGIKIRSMTSQVSQDTIEALGGTPVPMSYSELYTSLQTGVVEGQDNGLSNVYSSKFYEVQKYFHKTEHGYTINVVYANPDFYDSMTAEDQANFDKLAQQYLVDEYSENMNAYYLEAETALIDAGMIIVEQDQLDMQAFYDSADAVIQEKYVSNETYTKVISDVKAYCGY